MKFLTNNKVLVMMSGNGPIIESIPSCLTDLNLKMVWDFEHPELNSLAQIQERWPFIFAVDNPLYIPNLKLVEVDFDAYSQALDDHMNNEPHFLQFAKDVTGVHCIMANPIIY